MEKERAEKCDTGMAFRIVKFSGRPQERGRTTERTTKDEGDERGKRSRLTGSCFGPVLVRFLSIRRPAAVERDLHTGTGMRENRVAG